MSMVPGGFLNNFKVLISNLNNCIYYPPKESPRTRMTDVSGLPY